jgi:YidC/Oxa1 family membrane protein insertase
LDRNLLLAFALSFAVLMLWTMVMDPPPAPVEPGSPAATESPLGDPTADPGPDVPAPSDPLASALPSEPAPEATTPTVPSRTLEVETELFRARLDTRGAAITSWELRRFDASRREGGEPIFLVRDAAALTTPFRELGLGDLSQAVFELEREDGRTFVFRYTKSGVTVRKTYVFQEESYGFDLRVSVENAGDRSISPGFVVSWPVDLQRLNDFREQALAVMHEGSVERELLEGFAQPGFFDRDPEPFEKFASEVDWVGTDQPFFVSAILPDSPSRANARFDAVDPGTRARVSLYYDPVELPPGQPAEHNFRVFVGPKEPDRLEAMGGGLIYSIDLGWSWIVPLTRFFGWLLSVLHSVIPNYGLAIILLTVLVRLVTTPLTNKQMRSMERMRALSPKLQELKEKYGEDKQKQSEEMMKLYRQEGVNPLGGCLPMLLQLPVFIGLFYALRSSIQLRQAPFFGWIDDLSAPDLLFELPGIGIPVRVLPLLNGLTMLVQQRITPMQGMDPAQQKMMTTMMPIVMTVVFYQFPSGLVLYWMVSSVLAVSHQLWIGKSLRKS